ncbi:MAG: hypothetical protein L3J28_09375 [Candidatus Polarisedimenticolaceae bacterium]|nr:hypothetical protein [Candidatus Polarisedimenticolaceae bacterium]
MPIDIINSIGEAIFDLMLLTWATTFLLVLVILAMHFLMPSAVLDKYFKSPYFKDVECLLFTGIPYAPMRTIMFIRAIANPKSGKLRGITQAHLLVPNWYRVLSKVVIVSIYINTLLLLVFIIGAGVFYYMEW